MSTPADNAPAAHSAGAEESRPSLAALLLDPSFWADWASVVGLVGLVIVFGIAQPVFLSVANLQALLLAAAILVVLSIGQTFVIATSGIDLSLAAAVMLGAIILGLVNAAGYGIFVACGLAVLATSAVGFLNGLIITAGKIPDFVVTLGTLSGITGLGLILSGGEPTMVGSTFLLRLASGSLGPFGYPVWVAIAAVIVAHIALYHTRFGVHLLATGGQTESAGALGIRTNRVKIAAYTISGFCAGIAAILLVARIGSAEPQINTSLLLNSVAAVVLGGVSLFGGRASILGPAIGALMLTALVNGLTLLNVSACYQPLAVGAIVVLAALIMRYQK
ncbi:ABC transporter permease [Mesorhizobium sp. M7A.F.Ca.MR.176.00.0.0]|uniref:ABC transporter permease n=1 Tax=Mesorhizobium sp. M7A.F.Ca.MR.176.00.0.0 TaxID=2496776 RepID=UPI000FD41000|nr:ABC transporter permease [Mesorhizobium sp. M7A.F.Ca.MR.176.00.0.0]RUU90856.1 ABC transporter permease [Mesorhizobium sp. M7A.F.Ca.MR.176.00.0.0]